MAKLYRFVARFTDPRDHTIDTADSVIHPIYAFSAPSASPSFSLIIDMGRGHSGDSQCTELAYVDIILEHAETPSLSRLSIPYVLRAAFPCCFSVIDISGMAVEAQVLGNRNQI